MLAICLSNLRAPAGASHSMPSTGSARPSRSYAVCAPRGSRTSRRTPTAASSAPTRELSFDTSKRRAPIDRTPACLLLRAAPGTRSPTHRSSPAILAMSDRRELRSKGAYRSAPSFIVAQVQRVAAFLMCIGGTIAGIPCSANQREHEAVELAIVVMAVKHPILGGPRCFDAGLEPLAG